MAKTYDIAFKLGAKLDKQFRSTFNKVEDIASNTVKKVQKTVVALGAVVLGGIGLNDAIDTFKNFEQSMANTAAIAGITKLDEEYALLEQAALDAGKATSKTAQEAADALGYMKLAGWQTTEAMAGLMPVLRLSEASGMDLAKASDMVTDTMSALGLSVDEVGLNVNGLSGYLDIIAKAQNSANFNAEQLMESYLAVGGTMKSLKVPMEESAAVLGLMANRGTKGAEAGNSLNSIMVNLTAPTGKAAEALEKLGYSAFDTEGNFLGLENSLLLLQDKLSGATDEQMQYFTSAIGGKTQLTALQQILDGLGGEYDILKATILDNDGALNNMADTMNNTMEGAFARMSSAIDDMKINLIKNLEPFITPVINKVAEKLPLVTEALSEGLANAINGIKGIGDKIKGVLPVGLLDDIRPKKDVLFSYAKGLAGSLTEGIGQFISGESLSNALSGSLSAISGITSTLFGEEDGGMLFSVIEQRISLISDILDVVRDNVGAFAEAFTAGFETISQSVMPVILDVNDAFQQIFDDLLPVAGDIVSSIANNFGYVVEGIAAFFTEFSPVVSNIVDTVMAYLPRLYPVFETISSTVGLVVQKIGETLAVLAPVFADVFNFIAQNIIPVAIVVIGNIARVVQKVVEVIANALPIVAKVVEQIWNFIQPILQFLMDGFQLAFGFISTIIADAVDNIGDLINGLLRIFDGVIDFISGIFTGNWEKAWTGVKNIFSGIFDSLAALVKTPINAVISIINSALSGISSVNITIPDWVPGLGGSSYSINLPQIPMLAVGSNHSPETFIAGEKGAELITNAKGSKVFTAAETGRIFENLNRIPVIVQNALFGLAKAVNVKDGFTGNEPGLADEHLNRVQRKLLDPSEGMPFIFSIENGTDPAKTHETNPFQVMQPTAGYQASTEHHAPIVIEDHRQFTFHGGNESEIMARIQKSDLEIVALIKQVLREQEMRKVRLSNG